MANEEKTGIKRVLKTGSFSSIGMLLSQGISLASGLVIARAIGPANFGLFALCRDICQTLSLCTKSGFDIGIIRWAQSEKEASAKVAGYTQSALIFSILLSFIVLFSVWLGGSEWVGKNIYHNSDFQSIFNAMILLVPLIAIMQILAGFFRANFAIHDKIIAVSLLQPGSRLSIALVAFIFTVSIWSVVWATVASYLIASIYLLCRSRKLFHEFWKKVKMPDWKQFISFWRYSITLSFLLSIGLLLQKTDILMLGYFSTAEDVGKYAVVQLAVPLIALFNGAFSEMFAPMVAKLVHENDISGLKLAVQRHTRWMLIVSFPIFMTLVVFGQDLLKLFGVGYGAESEVIAFLAGGQLVTALFSSMGFMLSMTQKYYLELPIMLIGLVINICMNFFLIPVYGAKGAAVATLTALVIANIVRVVAVYLTYRIWPVGRGWGKPATIAIVSMPLFPILRSMISDASFLGALISSGIYVSLYVLLLSQFGLTGEDRDLLVQLKRRIGLGRVSG